MTLFDFRCDGSKTRLVGRAYSLGGSVQGAPYSRIVVFLVGSGTRLIGTLSRRNGRDVFALEGSATEFVGKLA